MKPFNLTKHWYVGTIPRVVGVTYEKKQRVETVGIENVLTFWMGKKLRIFAWKSHETQR